MAARSGYGFISITGLLLISVFAFAQSSATIPGLPELSWHGAPGSSWHFDNGDKVLTISAGPKTDWFVEASDGKVANSGPLLLFKPGSDYVLTTRVAVNFASKYDSAALMLWADD